VVSQPLSAPPHCFYVAGRAYATGAHAIVKSGTRARYQNDFAFIVPCMMLIGHAIESYLKAWLAFREYDPDDLKRAPFGHNLRNLYAEARTTGLPEPDMPPQQSFHDLVESYEKDHADFSFRYLREGWQFAVPKMDVIFDILSVLDRVVGAEIYGVNPAPIGLSVDPREDFRPSNA